MKHFEEWLLKAEHDLLSAQALSAEKHNLYDTAVYHTQQAAEKALKAFLVAHNKEIPKTHNVRLLLTQCCLIQDNLELLAQNVITVAPYDTLYRYPADSLSPSLQQTQAAIISASEILKTIKELL